MIECTFVYRFSSGGSSDSLRQKYKLHAVPKVGERVMFVGADSIANTFVKEVLHQIDTNGTSHEIIVYYGEE